MIEKIEKYIKTFEPIGEDARFNLEFLPDESVAYSLVEEPSFNNGKGIRVVKHYGNGMKLKELSVQLQRVTDYEELKQTNLDNSKFMKDFESWIDNNNKNRILPEIQGIQNVEITTSGYIEAVSADQAHAVYVVSLKFIYLEK